MNNMEIGAIDNKSKIAIVAIGYNRKDSISRLLNSLENAHYPHNDIPLVISIDASGDQDLYDFVSNYKWEYGEKYVNIQKERLGLRKHIIQCGDLTQYFKAVILLEDDIFVSEYFYQYVEASVEYYRNDDRIGGISLYQDEMTGSYPIWFMNDGSDAYLQQAPATWGECWTSEQWIKFKQWYDKFDDGRFAVIDMPDRFKNWKKAWSKYYMAYLIETNRYFVFPYISHTACFVDAGEHSSMSSTIGQACLLCGPKNYVFKPFEKMVRYDIYAVNEAVYHWLDIPKDRLCIDWYGNNHNHRHARYLLTTAKMKYPIVKSFGLLMHPIELNVKYNIKGEGLYLYDLSSDHADAIGRAKSKQFSVFLMHGISVKISLLYSFILLWLTVKKKCRL